MKRVNIYIVHTEFHVVTAVNIAVNHFKDYDNLIIIAGNRVKRHFSGNSFIRFEKSPDLYGNNRYLSKLVALNPDRFFFFQENDYDNIYLAYYISRTGATVALCEDGLKPYVVWHKRRLFLNVIMNAFNFYRNCITEKSFVPLLYINRFEYAFTKCINEVWLRFPDSYVNKTKKRIEKLDFSQESIQLLKQLFEFKFESTDNVILYVGQPKRNEDVWEQEYSIVSAIRDKYKDKVFIYKPHPNCDPRQIEKLSGIDNTIVYSERVPVELLILSLTNSLIFSMYSTGLLVENRSCKYYWIHKMINDPIVFSQLEIVNPTKHIKEVNNIDEISL